MTAARAARLERVTPDIVAAQVAEAFADAVRRTNTAGRRFRCAVPGGSVASVVFPRIARHELPWPIVDIFLADERFVAPGHPDSNARAVREHWLDHLDAVRPVFHPMTTCGVSADDAARIASATLCAVAGTPPQLDLVLLGVGPDGHVASLFPGLPGWRDSSAWVLAVHGAPKPPPDRLSLGLAALAAAREIWFVAFGAEKAAGIAEARAVPHSPLPVAVVARSGPRVRWFLDRDATAS
jgi:6-phosphogluconolactonase